MKQCCQSFDPCDDCPDKVQRSPLKGCKRCGRKLAYPGAVYCGAACSAMADADKETQL